MDDLWDRLEDLTSQMLSRLDVVSEDELLEYVEVREEVINQIKSYKWEEVKKAHYRDVTERILNCDKLIMKKMVWFQEQNNSGIHKINAAKRQKSAYDGEIQFDSVLFDRRK